MVKVLIRSAWQILSSLAKRMRVILKLSLHFFFDFLCFFAFHDVFSLEKTFWCDSVSIGHDCAEEAIFYTLCSGGFISCWFFVEFWDFIIFFSSSFDIIRVRDETKVSKSNGKMCALLDTLWRLWVLIAQTCVFKTEFLWGCKKGILSPSDLQVFLALSPCPSFFYIMF